MKRLAFLFFILSVVSVAQSSTSAAPQYAGYLDGASCTSIAGWDWNATQPTTPITVDIYSDGVKIATATANIFRQDLLNAGIGNGDHGFSLATPASVMDGNTHSIAAFIGGAQTQLSTSPKTLTCAPSGGTLQGYLDGASCSQIAGWAWSSALPNSPISVDIYDGATRLLSGVSAGTFRSDLLAAGIGNGDHAFVVATPASILDGRTHSISADFSGTQTQLSTSPKSVTCTPTTGPSDFSTPRANDLTKRTGAPGEDLLSGNFNWSLPIVTLKGRAGMDLGVALTYNSLVWTKSASSIQFNSDGGFPGPGFHLGFPIIQPKFVDAVVGVNAYLIIMPTGSRVEVRQVGSSNIYESGDSTYIQLVDNGTSGLVMHTPDGGQMTYQLQGSQYVCTQIKNKNGNFITINNSGGQISSIVDTLGRTITFNYNASNMLTSITQLWSGVTHTWASFTYSAITLQTNFSGLTLVGAVNGQNLTVPTQVTLANGSSYAFDYTSWGQVYQVRHIAAGGNELSRVTYNLPLTSSVAQSDCPRFTQKTLSAENWVGSQTSFVFDPVGLTGGQSTTPDGTVYKESYLTATWQRGLVSQVQIVSGGVAKATTAFTYTQDNTSLAYQQNPRVVQEAASDDAGNQRTAAISYQAVPLPSGATLSLPTDLQLSSNGTPLKRTHTDYRTDAVYLNNRILGLPSDTLVYDGSGVLAAQTSYQYDTGAITDEGAAVQHDEVNFGAGFVQGRGNRTVTQHQDVTQLQPALIITLAYDAAGQVITSTDPAGHQTQTSYADSFGAGTPPGLTLAYPTSMTNGDGFTSTTRYNYDNGEILLTQDPKGAQQVFAYDSVGRLLQQTYHDSVLGVDGTHTRYVYPLTMDQVQTFKLLDSGEVLSTEFLDGTGRVTKDMTSFPGSVGGFRGQQFVYDNMGRKVQTSNPTEVDSSFNPAGDDAGGFVFTSQQYDWAGRPTVHSNQDNTFFSVTYTGCGCAGGGVVVATDEVGRQARTTYDALGRPVKVEDLNSDTTVYRTAINTYNALDEITSMVVQQGSTGTAVTTTRTYDGFGRLASDHRPDQKPSVSTIYAYNLDGTHKSVTDGRGAIRNYVYNGRGLPTLVSYTKPDGSAAPGLTVTFGYDAAGNRTSMADSAGNVNYTYDTGGRLTNETRTFSGLTGTFSLNYTYNLTGEITSITDPFGGIVNYSYDAAGQLASMTGSGKGSVPVYISSEQYRAWGDPKQINYGNGASASYQHNSRMQPASYSVLDPTSAPFMGSTFTYYGDARVKNIKDLSRAFDGSYTYDQVGRLSTATSGSQAGLGSTVTGPYQVSLSYDVFNNMLLRGEQIWTAGDNSYSTLYNNNRNTAWTYDAEGNPLTTETTTFTYNAAGQQASSSDPVRHIQGRTISTTISQSYDGDGALSIQTVNASPTYFVRSSVLGQTITQLASDGTKQAGYVYANNQLLAEHQAGVTQLQWVHRNPATSDEGRTMPTGPGVQSAVLDPFGVVLPTQDPGAGPDGTPPDELLPKGGDVTDLSGGCTLDGTPTNCSLVAGLLNGDQDAFAQDPRFLSDFDQTNLWFAMNNARNDAMQALLQQWEDSLSSPGDFHPLADHGPSGTGAIITSGDPSGAASLTIEVVDPPEAPQNPSGRPDPVPTQGSTTSNSDPQQNSSNFVPGDRMGQIATDDQGNLIVKGGNYGVVTVRPQPDPLTAEQMANIASLGRYIHDPAYRMRVDMNSFHNKLREKMRQQRRVDLSNCLNNAFIEEQWHYFNSGSRVVIGGVGTLAMAVQSGGIENEALPAMTRMFKAAGILEAIDTVKMFEKGRDGWEQTESVYNAAVQSCYQKFGYFSF